MDKQTLDAYVSSLVHYDAPDHELPDIKGRFCGSVPVAGTNKEYLGIDAVAKFYEAKDTCNIGSLDDLECIWIRSINVLKIDGRDVKIKGKNVFYAVAEAYKRQES